MGATRTADSLTASLPSLKGGAGRVKRGPSDFNVGKPPSGWTQTPATLRVPRPDSPRIAYPLAERVATQANHGGQRLNAQWERCGWDVRVRTGPCAWPRPLTRGCLRVAPRSSLPCAGPGRDPASQGSCRRTAPPQLCGVPRRPEFLTSTGRWKHCLAAELSLL